MLSVLDFNVFTGSPLPFVNGNTILRNSSRLQKIIAEIERLNPDVVALQEVWCMHTQRTLISAFADGYIPIFGNQKPWYRVPLAHAIIATAAILLCFPFRLLLSRGLVIVIGLVVFLGLRLVLHGHPAYECFVGNETGLLMLVRNSLTLVTAQTKRLRTQTGDPLNIISPRGIQSAVVILPGSGFAVKIYNTHLNALGSGDARNNQVLEILESVRRAKLRGRCAILCVDLNADETSSAYRSMTSELSDAVLDKVGSASIDQHHTWINSNQLSRGGRLFSPDMRCDFVFYDAGLLRVLSALTVLDKPPLSDHFGVFASFTMAASSTTSQ
jgi:endonuclease/exonuclease/phosphatase family metal-dependent hydrolase